MDLNHARLPIPPLRLTACCARALTCCETLVSRTASDPVNEATVAIHSRESIRVLDPAFTWHGIPGLLGPDFEGAASLPQDLTTEPTGAPQQIPEDLALEIRRLAHDLSNALEIIVQTGYLLTMADLKPPADEWLRMLDSGVQKALTINSDLRTYIKTHTPK